MCDFFLFVFSYKPKRITCELFGTALTLSPLIRLRYFYQTERTRSLPRKTFSPVARDLSESYAENERVPSLSNPIPGLPPYSGQNENVFVLHAGGREAL